MKKATPPGRPGGKGLPSEAAPKTVAPTTMDGEVGDKLRGEEVEMEGTDPEEKNLKAARKAISVLPYPTSPHTNRSIG